MNNSAVVSYPTARPAAWASAAAAWLADTSITSSRPLGREGVTQCRTLGVVTPGDADRLEMVAARCGALLGAQYCLDHLIGGGRVS